MHCTRKGQLCFCDWNLGEHKRQRHIDEFTRIVFWLKKHVWHKHYVMLISWRWMCIDCLLSRRMYLCMANTCMQAWIEESASICRMVCCLAWYTIDGTMMMDNRSRTLAAFSSRVHRAKMKTTPYKHCDRSTRIIKLLKSTSGTIYVLHVVAGLRLRHQTC
jgi:hypothetical protein